MRHALHDELHARPAPRVSVPALIVYLAVLNEGVGREAECAHLRGLPGQGALKVAQLQGNFLHLELPGCTATWERHTEFTRYCFVQALPPGAGLHAQEPVLMHSSAVNTDWLQRIPGHTLAAIQLAFVTGDLTQPAPLMLQAENWLGDRNLVASQIGNGHSWGLTSFRIGADGFERMLVVAPQDTSETRAGRTMQRLLEIETYRLMALRGLPVAKQLGPMLAESEGALATITARLEHAASSEQELLDALIALAARVERATAEHSYRFSATSAYKALVAQRVGELREKPIPGTQTLGEFLQRRLSPAMATVAAAEQRLGSLSERIARTSALLRTRVDIAIEGQNQQLLQKLTHGQALQLRLQSTVEGLSIAAITYYVISLLLYGAKALKAAGFGIHPDVIVGALVPVVLWAVWRTTRRIHKTLHDEQFPPQA